ncbi:MAG: alpha/beta hydrolase [Actinomycetota bacterium]|nr:alpha/beta hydrolase [Actinomycetota bacterium]
MTVQPAVGDDSTPAWFSEAIANTPEHGDVEVRGAKVHARVWGERHLPGLVLIHGGSAHSGWWDHIAPLLSKTHRVVAIDLSGHGDSGWRESYDMATWGHEVIAVADAFIDGLPTVIGHSMGGGVALATVADHPDKVNGLIVIDTPLDPKQLERDGMRPALRPPRTYAEFEDAVARFRTIPEQAFVLPYVSRHVAEQSLKQREGVWTWKYDPSFLNNQSGDRTLPEMLASLQCSCICFRGEFGLVDQQMVERLYEFAGDRIPVVDLPLAGHHPMLDQPLTLVTALSTALALWSQARG